MVEGIKHTEIGWIPEDWEILKLSKIALLKTEKHMSNLLMTRAISL